MDAIAIIREQIAKSDCSACNTFLEEVVNALQSETALRDAYHEGYADALRDRSETPDCPHCTRPATKILVDACGEDPCSLRASSDKPHEQQAPWAAESVNACPRGPAPSAPVIEALILAQLALRRWTDLYAKLQNESGEVVSRKLDYNLPPTEHVRALESIADALEHVKAPRSATTALTALRNLMKESAGILALCEPELREAAGHTNVAVFQQRINEAGAILGGKA